MEELEEIVMSFRQFLENVNEGQEFSFSPTEEDYLLCRGESTTLITNHEFEAEVLDWALQYLLKLNCPSALASGIARNVLLQVETMDLDEILHDALAVQDPNTKAYDPLKLWTVVVGKVRDACEQWRRATDEEFGALVGKKEVVSVCAIKNGRRKMEDRHVVIQHLNTLFGLQGHPSTSFYAVFDGHAGTDAACYSTVHLHYNIVHHPSFPHDMETALKDGFRNTDQAFISKSNREGLKSGSTALCCLLRDKALYFAWVGDSQAILVRGGMPVNFMSPHKPDRQDERDRIENLGGLVMHFGTWRVNGTLAVSRAIGDVEFKPYVSSDPDVAVLGLDGTEDFVVLACDGLWDVLQAEDVVEAVYSHLARNAGDLDAVSGKLVQLAKERGSSDNITVVTVFLRDVKDMCAHAGLRRSPMSAKNASNLDDSVFSRQEGTDAFASPVNGNPFASVNNVPFEEFGNEPIDLATSPAAALALGSEMSQQLLGQQESTAVQPPGLVDYGQTANEFAAYDGPFGQPTADKMAPESSNLAQSFDGPFGYQQDLNFELSNAATGNYFEYRSQTIKSGSFDVYPSGGVLDAPVSWSDGLGDLEPSSMAYELPLLTDNVIVANPDLYGMSKPFESNLSPDAAPFVMGSKVVVHTYTEDIGLLPDVATTESSAPQFTPEYSSEYESSPVSSDVADGGSSQTEESSSQIPTAPPAEATEPIPESNPLETEEPVLASYEAESAALPEVEPTELVEDAALDRGLHLEIDPKRVAPSPPSQTIAPEVAEEEAAGGAVGAMPDVLGTFAPALNDSDVWEEKTEPEVGAPAAQSLLMNFETVVSEVKFDYSEDVQSHPCALASLESAADAGTVEFQPAEEVPPLLTFETEPKSAAAVKLPDGVPAVADDVEDDESEDGEGWKYYRTEAAGGELHEAVPVEVAVAPRETPVDLERNAADNQPSADKSSSLSEGDFQPLDSSADAAAPVEVVPVQPAVGIENEVKAKAPAVKLSTRARVPATKTPPVAKAAAATKAGPPKASSLAEKSNQRPSTVTATKSSADASRKPLATKQAAAKVAPPATTAGRTAKTTTEAAKSSSAAARPAKAAAAARPSAPATITMRKPAAATAAKVTKEQSNVRSKPVAAVSLTVKAESVKVTSATSAATAAKKAPPTAASVTARLATAKPQASSAQTKKEATAAAAKPPTSRMDVKQTKETVNKQISVGVRRAMAPTKASLAKAESAGAKAAPLPKSPQSANGNADTPDKSPPKLVTSTPKGKTSATRTTTTSVTVRTTLTTKVTDGKPAGSAGKDRSPTAKCASKTGLTVRANGKALTKSPAAAAAAAQASAKSPFKGEVDDACNEKGVLDASSKEVVAHADGLIKNGEGPGCPNHHEGPAASNAENGSSKPASDEGNQLHPDANGQPVLDGDQLLV